MQNYSEHHVMPRLCEGATSEASAVEMSFTDLIF